MFGSEPGIDPYTRMVSDVYQDLFGEGSFIGKGIYDVDAFEHALERRLPDNRILSHDLLEGCYARAGLVSDVQLYEDYPAALRRRRQAPASLDPRRLADAAVAAAVATGAATRGNATRCQCCRAGSCSTTCAAAWCRRLWSCCWWAGCMPQTPVSWTAWMLALWLVPPLVASLRDACAASDATGARICRQR